MMMMMMMMMMVATNVVMRLMVATKVVMRLIMMCDFVEDAAHFLLEVDQFQCHTLPENAPMIHFARSRSLGVSRRHSRRPCSCFSLSIFGWRNVPARCSQSEIEELLQSVTANFKLQMPRSSERKCKGYAFVEGLLGNNWKLWNPMTS